MNVMRTYAFILITITLLIAGAIMLLSKNDDNGTEAGSDAIVNSETELFEVPLLSTSQTRTVFSDRHLTVSLDVPRVHLLKHPELALTANTVIDTFVGEMVNEATSDIAQGDQMRHSEEPATDFVLGWSPLLVSPQIISIRFDYSTYFPGAVHPDYRTRTFNYDLKRQMVLETTDLFASSSLALPFLSTYARHALPQYLETISGKETDEQIMQGTDPTIENFREVGITPNGIVVIFNPSQVTAYARGTIALPIPLADTNAFVTPTIAKAITQSTENFRAAVPLQ